jgi:hypothetical protein
MRELWDKRRNGEDVDRERMEELMASMRDIREVSPLMNRDYVIEQVEALLPEEQVAQGRARAEKRREEWRQRFEERRAEGFGRRGGRGRDGASESDRWDRYYDDFKERYNLDAPQLATADSIVREMKAERDIYMAKHKADFDGLESIEDRRERYEKSRELSAPMDDLFKRLRQRLDGILTRSQRVEGGEMPSFWDRDRSSSRRRGPSSRPAGATTRPERGRRGRTLATTRPAVAE